MKTKFRPFIDHLIDPSELLSSRHVRTRFGSLGVLYRPGRSGDSAGETFGIIVGRHMIGIWRDPNPEERLSGF